MIRAMTILLVEDDTVDAMAIKRAFRQLRFTNTVIEARNGVEALVYLRGESGHDRLPQPCLVLLDLKMPKMGGIECLEAMRDDPSLKCTPVFVLTTSDAEEDRRRAYEKNVAGYMLKHHPTQSFLETIGVLVSYWQAIELPPM
jgi:CheY-like chemotaxis protein